jgi:hypothetical protein
MQDNLEHTVTERQILVADSYYVSPAVSERLELGDTVEGKSRRPDVAGWDARPERYRQIFKPSKGSKTSVSYLLDGQDLKNEVPDGAGTHVHLATIGGGTLTIQVGGFELSVFPVVLVSAEPHINDSRNGIVSPERISKAPREKRITKPPRVVENNGSLKGKQRH